MFWRGEAPMTLADLAETLLPQFPTSLQKDVKTAVRTLAHAMKYADPKDCPLAACQQPLPDLYRRIDAHLTVQAKKGYTIRNTKNLISRLFRLADAHALLPLAQTTLTKRFSIPSGHIPHRRADRIYPIKDGSSLTRRHWPASLEADFRAFTHWATDPIVANRPAEWKKRPPTVRTYQMICEAYFGYLFHQQQIESLNFDHLFDFDLIQQYVHWHVNEKHKRPTRTIKVFLTKVKALTRQYRPNTILLEQLHALDKQIPVPRPVYQKEDAWVSLHELDQVSTALWPTKTPVQLRKAYKIRMDNPKALGNHTATRAALSVMLQIWIHIPFRRRNMLEMKRDTNLYQTPEGQWRIRFSGDELKTAMKRGQLNAVDFPVPPVAIPHLMQYLETWRPLLAQIHHRPEVFLNIHGQPWEEDAFSQRVKRVVYEHTGRYFHPHMIRTVWATEWIKSSGDFMTAAIMLNDRLETVIANYSHLRDENVAENAYKWVQGRVNGH
jgi:hypothetical protein